MSRGGTESNARPPRSNLGGGGGVARPNGQDRCTFQMPLHYPRYGREEYLVMPEWKLDCLLKEYGLYVSGDVDHKRRFAMGAFLWGY